MSQLLKQFNFCIIKTFLVVSWYFLVFYFEQGVSIKKKQFSPDNRGLFCVCENVHKKNPKQTKKTRYFLEFFKTVLEGKNEKIRIRDKTIGAR